MICGYSNDLILLVVSRANHSSKISLSVAWCVRLLDPLLLAIRFHRLPNAMENIVQVRWEEAETIFDHLFDALDAEEEERPVP